MARLGLVINDAHACTVHVNLMTSENSTALQTGMRPFEPSKATFWKRATLNAVKKSRPKRRK